MNWVCLRCLKGRHVLCERRHHDGRLCSCELCTGLVTCELSPHPHKLNDDGTRCRFPKVWKANEPTDP